MPSLQSLTHVFASWSTLGGVETILRHHYAHDRPCGFDSRFVVTFEPRSSTDTKICALGCNGWTSAKTATARFRSASAEKPGSLLLYHNLWGLRSYGAWDKASRRFGFVHSDSQIGLNDVRDLHHALDGVICAGTDLAALVREIVSDKLRDRVLAIDYPVADVFLNAPRSWENASSQTTLRIGYSGRLVQEQKQVRDLLVFVRALKQAGVVFELEILGEGAERPWLEDAFRDERNVTFRGHITGADYVEAVQRWHVVFLCSEYETGPLSVLEAMAGGGVPLIPDIPCSAKNLAVAIDPALLFPPRDYAAAAAQLANLVGAGAIPAIGAKCRQALQARSVAAYMERVTHWLRASAGEVQISQTPRPKSPPAALLPCGILGRLFPSVRLF